MARPKLGPNRQPWKGIDANERAYGSVHNALVGIILDGVTGVSPALPGHEWRTLSPEKADQYLERGRRVLADFESQNMAPGGARGKAQRWMDGKIDQLRRLVSDAEAVRSGTRSQKQTPESYAELRKHLGVTERKRHAPHAGRGRMRERDFSMTYGQLPSFQQFGQDIRRADPDHPGRAYWPEGEMYSMELVTPPEIELAEAFGLEEFRAERARTGRNTNVRGFRDNERAIYEFLEYLSDRWNNGDEFAGDLASGIMTSLGYEWI